MKLVNCTIIVLVSVWLSLICGSTVNAAVAPAPLEAVHEEGVYIEINKKAICLPFT